MTTQTQINKNKSYWDEDPRVPACDWQYEVANGDTRLGYWEFVAARMDEDEELGVDTPSSPPLSSDDEQTEIEKENAQTSWETSNNGSLPDPPGVECGTLPSFYQIRDAESLAEVATALRSIARGQTPLRRFEPETEVRIPMRLLLKMVHGESCIS